MKLTKWRNYQENIIGATVMFALGGTYEQAIRSLERHFKCQIAEPNEDLRAEGACIVLEDEDGKRCYAIWLKEKSLNALVHEAMHLLLNVFSHKGLQISVDNEETMSYYTAFWTSTLYGTVKGWKA